MPVDYGFQSINDSGTYQIDSNYRNLLFVAQGTISTTTANGGYQNISFPTQTTCLPLVFIRPHATGQYIGGTLVSMSDFQISNQCAFDYMVFGLDSTAKYDLGTWGIQVFDSAGHVVFDSRYKFPAVTEVWNISQSWSTSAGTGMGWSVDTYPKTYTLTAPFGSIPFVCINPFFNLQDGYGTMYAFAATTTTVSVTVGAQLSGTSWTTFTTSGSPNGWSYVFPFGACQVLIGNLKF